jgi:hypothetical protein
MKFIIILNLIIIQVLNSLAQIKPLPVVYNFSLAQYNDFLIKLKNNPKIVFVLQKDFENFDDTTKIAVSMRHDVDVDINNALKMAKLEANLGIHTTYFILHTADYYHPKDDYSTHNSTILSQMQYIQNLGHEIGIHNDLLTLQIVYNISPTKFLHKELKWMRDNGLKIYGTASHGSYYCKKYKYLNLYFFYKCAEKMNYPAFPNKNFVIKDNKKIYFEKAKLSDFGFSYESYCLDYTKYYSDCSTNPDGSEKNPTNIDISKWKPGDKIIILTHPIHWKDTIKNKLCVYPNPCKNFLNIFSPNFTEIKVLKLTIFNIEGMIIYNKNILYNHGVKINFNLPKGFYLLKIEDVATNKFYFNKFMVE